jgi:hypothetical protein
MNNISKSQWRRTPSVAYRLSDGKRIQADTIAALAAKMGISSNTIANAARRNHVYGHEWFVCHLADEAKLKAELDHWLKWYEGQRGKCKACKTSQTDRVALRIDSKTVIMVKPENANERYAEEYRKKMYGARMAALKKDRMREMNNSL